MKSYSLVACDFHDELEALATLRQVCQILYYGSEGEMISTESVIVDLYAAGGADFLKLMDGTKIRLDHLISVNQKRLQLAE